MHKVFVYGTLRPHTRDGYKPATHILIGYDMFNYHNKFPFIMPDQLGSAIVYGTVIEVDDAGLAELDYIEGVDNDMYQRIEVEVLDKSDNLGANPIKTFVYISTSLMPKRIISGDWTIR